MAWSLAPAIRSLIDDCNRRWPNRRKTSDVTIGDAAHASRTSDHNPDGDNMVCAFDLTHDPARGPDCHVVSEELREDRRVKYLIWNRRIWNPSVSPNWRAYSGSNPHDKHMHVSVTQTGKRDARPWFATTQEDDMPLNAEDKQWLTEMVRDEIGKKVVQSEGVYHEPRFHDLNNDHAEILEAIKAIGGGGADAERIIDELAERIRRRGE